MPFDLQKTTPNPDFDRPATPLQRESYGERETERERERDREREREGERARKRERERGIERGIQRERERTNKKIGNSQRSFDRSRSIMVAFAQCMC